MARFRVSPSRLARFYFHECERYLRYSTATKEQRKLDDIPPIELDHTLVTKAILESGYEWERVVLEHLGDRAVVAEGDGEVTERRHSADETLSLLAHATDGEAIYQPTLRAPVSFYEAYPPTRDVPHPPARPVARDAGRRSFLAPELPLRMV